MSIKTDEENKRINLENSIRKGESYNETKERKCNYINY